LPTVPRRATAQVRHRKRKSGELSMRLASPGFGAGLSARMADAKHLLSFCFFTTLESVWLLEGRAEILPLERIPY
jgi:hypothetical protein